jgi:hypothetical protein
MNGDSGGKLGLLSNKNTDLTCTEMNKKTTDIGNELLSFLTTKNTAMQKKLNDEYKDKIEYRNSRSILLDNSPDKIIYRTVTSNSKSTLVNSNNELLDVGDKVNKMTIFEGQENFSTKD